DVREIDPDERGGGAFGEEAQADGAAPHPDLHDAARLALGEEAERGLDEGFRLGARHEDAGANGEAVLVEVAEAHDVRDGLVRAAPRDELTELRALLVVERAVEVHVEPHAREPEPVRDEQLGVEARRAEPALLEVLGGPGEDPTDRPALAHGPAVNEA